MKNFIQMTGSTYRHRYGICKTSVKPPQKRRNMRDLWCPFSSRLFPVVLSNHHTSETTFTAIVYYTRTLENHSGGNLKNCDWEKKYRPLLEVSSQEPPLLPTWNTVVSTLMHVVKILPSKTRISKQSCFLSFFGGGGAGGGCMLIVKEKKRICICDWLCSAIRINNIAFDL